MRDDQKNVWIFGYGSLIWDTGATTPVERREGVLRDWHREWTWISERRHGAPTCSLLPGGQVRGVFLRLEPRTANQDLEEFRRREKKDTEKSIGDTPESGATTLFWTMGNNLDSFAEFRGLSGDLLARALAIRARQIALPGPDDVTAENYIRRVHQFDPDVAITAAMVTHL